MARPSTDPVQKLLARVTIANDCWIVPASSSMGYSQVGVGSERDGTNTVRLGHRVLWENQNGPVPDGLELHHRCEVRACINPDHLELVDHAEHAEHHAADHAVLTPDEVTDVRTAHANGESMRSIGRRYGVHHRTISRVLRGIPKWSNTKEMT